MIILSGMCTIPLSLQYIFCLNLYSYSLYFIEGSPLLGHQEFDVKIILCFKIRFKYMGAEAEAVKHYFTLMAIVVSEF